MARTTWKLDPKAKRISVNYESTTQLQAGYPVCYNYDTTDNWTGFGPATAGAASTEQGTTAEGEQNEGKYLRVETPATANFKFFAGVVAPGDWVNDTDGVLQIEIYPSYDGAIVPIWTDRNIVAKDPLYLETATFTVTTIETEDGFVGYAVETVDRSSTAGIVLVQLTRTKVAGSAPSARGRAATALPTAAIWDNFDLDAARRNPFHGSLLETDFTHGEALPSNFVDATYAATAAGKTPTEGLRVGGDADGELILFSTTDNQAVEVQWPCPIQMDGASWAFEASIKQSTLTDTRGNYFIGLAIPRILDGDSITDAAALVDGGAIGYQLKEADGNAVDFIYDETSQTQNEHDDNIFIPVADTYDVVGMYYNGTTIQMWVNGVSTGTAVSAVNIAAADFPTTSVLVPVIYHKSANAADFTVTVDWIRAYQSAS